MSESLVAHLQAAVESPVGIALTFMSPDDTRLVRQKLYALIREHVEYRSLFLRIVGEELWIVKREIPDE